MFEYYLLGKLIFLLLLPVNILFRQRVAIEKWGLEKYKNVPGKDLFSTISWRDSDNQFFRIVLRFSNYGLIFSALFYSGGLLYLNIF